MKNNIAEEPKHVLINSILKGKQLALLRDISTCVALSCMETLWFTKES